jgi:hypothetical protein
MIRRLLSRFAVGLCLSLVASTAAAADDELVRQVRDGHRAARESIRTFTAKITFEKIHPEKGVIAQGRYWRSGSTVRIQEGPGEGIQTEDTRIRGGETRELNRKWDAKKPSPMGFALRRPGDVFISFCDVWREMMIEQGCPAGGLGLDRILETADGPVRANRENLEGRPCIRLRYTLLHGMTPKGTRAKEVISQWHDIGRNYLIRQLISEPEGPLSSKNIIRVTDFIEPSPGVVFPVRVQRDHYKKGELFQTNVVAVTDAVINKPIPAADLELPAAPRGTILKDQIENRQGPIDSDWKPIGAMTPLAPRAVPPANRAPLAAIVESGPSTSEPVSSARWILVASTGVLLLAAGVVVARRLWPGRRPAIT